MPDLKVSSIAVDDAAVQLRDIVDEFDNMNELWEDGDVWGHDTVKKAMRDFIDDWPVKRKKLSANLSDLQGKMEQAKETWDDTEIQLAESFDGDGK